MERNLLAIYLNDHLAGATVGLELARRSLKSNRDNDFGDFLGRLSEEIGEDRGTLRSVMGELGVRVDLAKQAGAWGSEKIGRLKPNGRLIGYSPLSRLVELEFLEIGITGKLGMWRALQQALDEGSISVDLPALITRADRQRSEVDAHRLRAATCAFGAG